MAAAIHAHGVTKDYGKNHALRGVDLRVEVGECVAVLGPNGAGKTTFVEILEGFRPRDGGEVEVLGLDPVAGGNELRERIGIVLQQCGVEPYLSVIELLRLHASYYRHPRDPAEVLELVGLPHKERARIKTLSGGQQRRVDLALGLIGDPEVIFLDEPTTGFDPTARRDAWDVVSNLGHLGKTVLLTTHYLDEAQQLADRVVVIAHGRVIAEGTPDQLGGRHDAPATIRFLLPADVDAADLPVKADLEGDAVVVETETPTATLAELTTWAVAQGRELPGLAVSRPSLEDIYLELTAEAEEPSR